MSIDRIRLPGDRLPERLLGLNEVLLAEIEASEHEIELRSVRKGWSRLFQPSDRRGDLLRGAHGSGKEGQGLEVFCVYLKDERRFLLGLGRPAYQQVNSAQLLSHIEVRGVQLHSLSKIVERQPGLAERVMSEPQLPDGPCVGRIDLQDISAFDDGLSVPFACKIPVAAFETEGLLRLRRPCAASQSEDGQEKNDQCPSCSRHLYLLRELSRVPDNGRSKPFWAASTIDKSPGII